MDAAAGEGATTAAPGRSVDGVGRPSLRESLQVFPAIVRHRDAIGLFPLWLLVGMGAFFAVTFPGPVWPVGVVGGLGFVVLFAVFMSLGLLLLTWLKTRRPRNGPPRIHLDESGVSVTVSTGFTLTLAWESTRVRFVARDVVGLRARKGLALMVLPLSAFTGRDRVAACELLSDKLGVDVR